jgi:hypothetical protein
MNATVRNGVLVFLEVLIGFAVICVLPFAWILRDGLGPSAVSTTGLAAASKTFMSFYIGPVILFLVSLDLAVRRFVPVVESPSPKQTWIIWVIAFASVVLLSYGMVWLMFGS